MAKVIEIGSIDTTQYVNATEDQTINGVKTFTKSPIVPVPTTETQVANKKYIDDLVANIDSGNIISCTEEEYYASEKLDGTYYILTDVIALYKGQIKIWPISGYDGWSGIEYDYISPDMPGYGPILISKNTGETLLSKEDIKASGTGVRDMTFVLLSMTEDGEFTNNEIGIYLDLSYMEWGVYECIYVEDELTPGDYYPEEYFYSLGKLHDAGTNVAMGWLDCNLDSARVFKLIDGDIVVFTHSFGPYTMSDLLYEPLMSNIMVGLSSSPQYTNTVSDGLLITNKGLIDPNTFAWARDVQKMNDTLSTLNTTVANIKNPVYSNSQYSVGCYYSTSTLTTLNTTTYLNVGEYGLGISSDCTGKPAAITAATRILLKTISTYPTPNATYSPYIRQDLYVPSLDRHWYRIVNYAASNNITYGEWQEIDLAFEVVS